MAAKDAGAPYSVVLSVAKDLDRGTRCLVSIAFAARSGYARWARRTAPRCTSVQSTVRHNSTRGRGRRLLRKRALKPGMDMEPASAGFVCISRAVYGSAPGRRALVHTQRRRGCRRGTTRANGRGGMRIGSPPRRAWYVSDGPFTARRRGGAPHSSTRGHGRLPRRSSGGCALLRLLI